jgi:hypothetical protein
MEGVRDLPGGDDTHYSRIRSGAEPIRWKEHLHGRAMAEWAAVWPEKRPIDSVDVGGVIAFPVAAFALFAQRL